MYYEFRIVLPSPAGMPPEEVRRSFRAKSERQARKLATEWAGPNATVGECSGCWSRN